MAITLTRAVSVNAQTTQTVQTIELPESLVWTDELAWVAVSQKTDYSIEGALVIDRFVRQAGRPITLEGRASPAWMELGALRQLRAWAADPSEATLRLNLHGDAHRVIFDLAGDGAVGGEPLAWWRAGDDAGEYGNLKLKFLEV